MSSLIRQICLFSNFYYLRLLVFYKKKWNKTKLSTNIEYSLWRLLIFINEVGIAQFDLLSCIIYHRAWVSCLLFNKNSLGFWYIVYSFHYLCCMIIFGWLNHQGKDLLRKEERKPLEKGEKRWEEEGENGGNEVSGDLYGFECDYIVIHLNLE